MLWRGKSGRLRGGEDGKVKERSGERNDKEKRGEGEGKERGEEGKRKRKRQHLISNYISGKIDFMLIGIDIKVSDRADYNNTSQFFSVHGSLLILSCM